MKRNKLEGTRWIALGLLLVLGTVCGRAQVAAYHVPKEKPAALSPPTEVPPAEAVSERPLDWVTPSGWKELPGDTMRIATFAIKGQGGKQAQATIVPIGGKGGTMLDNVNRWRNQLGLGPLDQAAITKQLVNVEIGSTQGQFYEVAGALPDGTQSRPSRILVAILLRDDTSWFFKMIGDDALVAEQKPAFLQFLKSVSFNNNVVARQHDVSTPAPTSSADFASIHQGMNLSSDFSPRPTSNDENHPAWQVPANWQRVEASPMLVAKFRAAGTGDAKADINVSAGPGLGGGLAPNINRWRAQLGLSPVDEAGLGKLISHTEVAGSQAMLVDMSGSDPESGDAIRTVAVIVPSAEQTWFFKLMGNAGVVEKERAALIQFVQSVQFNHAH